MNMECFEELASEAAESALAGEEKEEKRIGKRLTLLSFSAPKPFPSFSLFRGKGKYHTILRDGNILEISELFEEIIKAVAESVKSFVGGIPRGKRILAVGLGNPSAVVDRLGSETVKRLDPAKERSNRFFILSPSVFGLTGIESAEIARGVAREIHPDLVLAVDTLATRKVERLCRAVQITNAGISPGGGVGNERKGLTEETVGAPVLSVGVPLLCHARFCEPLPSSLVVTPKEIDLFVPSFADILSRAFEKAFS